VNAAATNAPRTSGVIYFQSVRLKRGCSRATRCLTSAGAGLHDILLHFNVADEVSCRAGAIKCSRCRAPFAPILTTLADRSWFPRWVGNSPAH